MFKKHRPGKYILPSAELNPADEKSKSSTVRKGIFLIILFVVLFAGYFAYDMSQAKRMAADACIGAIQGMPLEDFLAKFSEKDYRIIRRAQYLMIVPKKGYGRNNCTVSHDAGRITGSKTWFND